ncbi:putative thiamine transporter SLC35F3 [Hypsibius exemplaris]|uniref:Thiamine transporter SLC35F3 n=1 Tax=Hypsibius exemplaris TaxID=2072580 RepID=A0A1W0WNL5_HYPEX|nr:putative thiamine transporter SLC35F3 [Hypsibius exemplaris]
MEQKSSATEEAVEYSQTRRKLAVSALGQREFQTPGKKDKKNYELKELGQTNAGDVEAAAEEPSEPALLKPDSVMQVAFLVLLVLLVTAFGVADSQLAKETYSDKFNAPFLILYVGQMTRTLTFPLFLLVSAIIARVKNRPFSARETTRDCLLVFGPQGLTIITFLKVIPVLAIVGNVVGLGLYLSALAFISSSETTTLMTSQVAMIYVISIFLLKQQVLAVKVFATLLSFGGVAMTAISKGFQGDSSSGIVLALISAAVYASMQTYMKYVLYKPNLGRVCLYMSSTSAFVLLVGWVFPLSMRLTNFEKWDFDTAPWLPVFGASSATLLSSIFYNYGVSIASPFFMSMYNLALIPANNSSRFKFEFKKKKGRVPMEKFASSAVEASLRFHLPGLTSQKRLMRHLLACWPG